MTSTLPDLGAVLANILTAICNVITAVVDAVAANAGVIAMVLITVGVMAYLTTRGRGVFSWLRGILPF